MELKIETSGIRGFNLNQIIDHLEPWEKEHPTRAEVARACREIFRESFVYIGGCHVAVHNPITKDRMILITGNHSDFK